MSNKFYQQQDQVQTTIDKVKTLKFLITGDSGVGKTQLLFKLLGGDFRQEHEPTVGIEFGIKYILEDNVKLVIFDLAGQERFRAIIPSYYRGAVCALIVYDITQRNTFEDIINYRLKEVKHLANENTVLVLVGNKQDLKNNRAVSFEEGQCFARESDILFFEASAKTGYNIDEIFTRSTEKVLQIIDLFSYDLNTNQVKLNSELNIEINQQQQKRCC